MVVGAASQNALSFLRIYYDVQKKRIYPFLTAIMDVESGTVRGITWDDACVFCGGGECEENTYNYDGQIQNPELSGQATKSCYIEQEDCKVLEDGKNSCDLTLYTVWTGSDADGLSLQSQSYRFSEFPPQELKDRVTQVFSLDL